MKSNKIFSIISVVLLLSLEQSAFGMFGPLLRLRRRTAESRKSTAKPGRRQIRRRARVRRVEVKKISREELENRCVKLILLEMQDRHRHSRDEIIERRKKHGVEDLMTKIESLLRTEKIERSVNINHMSYEHPLLRADLKKRIEERRARKGLARIKRRAREGLASIMGRIEKRNQIMQKLRKKYGPPRRPERPGGRFHCQSLWGDWPN